MIKDYFKHQTGFLENIVFSNYIYILHIFSQARAQTLVTSMHCNPPWKKSSSESAWGFHLLTLSLFFASQLHIAMKTSHGALVTLFALFVIHFLMCSALSLHHERYTHPRERSQSRRLLASITPLSAHLNKLNGATEESKKTVEACLRKAPSSAPNPTQNK